MALRVLSRAAGKLQPTAGPASRFAAASILRSRTIPTDPSKHGQPFPDVKTTVTEEDVVCDSEHATDEGAVMSAALRLRYCKAGACLGDTGSGGGNCSFEGGICGDKIYSVGWRASAAGVKEGAFPNAEVVTAARRAADESGMAAVFIVDPSLATSAGRAAISSMSSGVEAFLLAGDDLIPLDGDSQRAALQLYLEAGDDAKRVDLSAAGWTAIAAAPTATKEAAFAAAERVPAVLCGGGKHTVRARAYSPKDTIVAAAMGARGRVRPSADVDGLRLVPSWFSTGGDAICGDRLKGPHMASSTAGYCSKGTVGGNPSARGYSTSSPDDARKINCCHARERFSHSEREGDKRNKLVLDTLVKNLEILQKEFALTRRENKTALALIMHGTAVVVVILAAAGAGAWFAYERVKILLENVEAYLWDTPRRLGGDVLGTVSDTVISGTTSILSRITAAKDVTVAMGKETISFFGEIGSRLMTWREDTVTEEDLLRSEKELNEATKFKFTGEDEVIQVVPLPDFDTDWDLLDENWDEADMFFQLLWPLWEQ